jgi:hypothetical protein
MTEPKKVAGGTLFHVLHGESGFMYEVDRRLALARFPDEWRDRPWTAREAETYNTKRRKQAKAEEAPAGT